MTYTEADLYKMYELAIKGRKFNEARKELLEDRVDCDEGRIYAILDLVCDYYKITEKDMRKRSRKPLYVSARRAFCFLCRKFTQKSLKQIGKVIQRDHVLVLYQVRTTQDFLDIKDPQTVKEVKALTDLYYQAVLIKNKKRDQRKELEKSQLKEIISDKVEP